MNLAQHLQRFYADLREPDLNRFPLDTVKAWLDEAERVVNKRSRTIRSSEEQDSAANTRLYDYPSDILDWQIRDVYYSTTDSTERKRLTPSTIQKLDKLDRKWRTRTGPPVYWYHDKEGAQWGIQPYEASVASGTNCIEIIYRALHTKMTRYYTTGTVDITYNTISVTGNSTAFIGNVIASDELGIGKLLDRTTAFPTNWFALASTPVSDTAATIATFTEATVSAASYIIASPSSIDNVELNLCSVLWAMSLARQRDKDFSGRDALQQSALARVMAEVGLLEADAMDDEPVVPEMAAQYPGTRQDDYQ